eukprot:407314_1
MINTTSPSTKGKMTQKMKHRKKRNGNQTNFATINTNLIFVIITYIWYISSTKGIININSANTLIIALVGSFSMDSSANIKSLNDSDGYLNGLPPESLSTLIILSMVSCTNTFKSSTRHIQINKQHHH